MKYRTGSEACRCGHPVDAHVLSTDECTFGECTVCACTAFVPVVEFGEVVTKNPTAFGWETAARLTDAGQLLMDARPRPPFPMTPTGAQQTLVDELVGRAIAEIANAVVVCLQEVGE